MDALCDPPTCLASRQHLEKDPYLHIHPSATYFSDTMEPKIEEGEAPLRHPSNAAAPRPRRLTPDHPPYAEMVRVALREMAEEGGSTGASISRYILSNYTRLPPAHSRLLPYYLGKFVAAGEVSMLFPNRFALPPTPPHYPIPTPDHHHHHHHANPNPNPRLSSFGQEPGGPQIPRRRGRRPKRKIATTSGSAVGILMLPPWPNKSRHNATDSGASPAPRRGRGRPRKNPETTKAPTPAHAATVGDPVPRPRLIIRLRSKPPKPMPDTAAAAEVTSKKCDSRNGDGSEAALPAIAHIDEDSALMLPVEMLHMDRMQPQPEPPWKEGLSQLLPRQSETEVDLLPLPGPEQSELHEEQLAPSSPVPLRMELIEFSSPKEEPLLLPSIQIEPKEEILSLTSVEPLPAVEKSERSGHSSKHRRTLAKHRRLWFEC